MSSPALVLALLRLRAAGRRSAPSGGPSPGCRAAARGRRGRSSPARPCRARRAADRGRCCAGSALVPALAAPSSSTDWYSAVGMFFRLASSCLSVSTVLVRCGFLGHDLVASRSPAAPSTDVDHLVELALDLGLEVGLDLVDLGELGERPAAVACRGGSRPAPSRCPSSTSSPSRPRGGSP